MKFTLKYIFYPLAVLLIVLLVAGCSLMNFSPQFGASAEGTRLERMQQSPNYKDGIFQNPVTTNMDIGFKGYIKLLRTRLFGNTDDQEPEKGISALKVYPDKLQQTPDTATVITWLGHSAFIVQIDGKRLLLDPMLSDRASPLSFMGPERFAALPLIMHEMPAVDAVLISHDHYDHLDYESIKTLAGKTDHFYVALGVGAHLERWGVPASKITELDWWQEAEFEGLTFAATPARHFSGRGFSDRMKTLWVSWVIQGKSDKIYFSGDTGYFDGFKEIGEKYGPFDITLLECGQYNTLWESIHMMPEQTIQAHIDLKGKLMMPIHWGAFALAMHSWTDPIERVTKKAAKMQVNITTPRIGEPVILHQQAPKKQWWKQY